MFPNRFIILFLSHLCSWNSFSANGLSLQASSLAIAPTFAIIGGTGKIGTSIASHILLRDSKSNVILIGRNIEKGKSAVSEVRKEIYDVQHSNNISSSLEGSISFQCADWKQSSELKKIADEADCIIHTAGPFLDEKPDPLRQAIASERCRVYVDVSDPLEFLEASLEMKDLAKESGTSALLAAGAFPGMSNVLAMEAANLLAKEQDPVKDVRFNYFTAGLGGSGDVNLFITNIGFGEDMVQYDNGSLRFYKALSGLLLGKVDFFLDNGRHPLNENIQSENAKAKNRIGRQTVFSWPFPEAATVARELKASGQSSAAMGTAPDIWNTMLGILVTIIPRKWWRSRAFSKFLADFSQPLVKFSDFVLKLSSPDKVGETHAMRVDVIGESGNSYSCVQAHESFRRCVGQSCAEFALDLLDHPSPGVQMPEQRYKDDISRKRIIERLTTTTGTIAYTGAVAVESAPRPTGLDDALRKANADEEKLSFIL